MAEKYTEELLSWDAEAQSGNVKVIRTEQIEISGRHNTHSQESMFEGATLAELEDGLAGLVKNKEQIDGKLQEAQGKVNTIKSQIEAMSGALTLTEELLELERKVQNIGMLREIEKLKTQVDDHKTAITELDEKVLARSALLNQIRGA